MTESRGAAYNKEQIRKVGRTDLPNLAGDLQKARAALLNAASDSSAFADQVVVGSMLESLPTLETLSYGETGALWSEVRDGFAEVLDVSVTRIENAAEALRLCAKNYDDTDDTVDGMIQDLFETLD